MFNVMASLQFSSGVGWSYSVCCYFICVMNAFVFFCLFKKVVCAGEKSKFLLSFTSQCDLADEGLITLTMYLPQISKLLKGG